MIGSAFVSPMLTVVNQYMKKKISLFNKVNKDFSLKKKKSMILPKKNTLPSNFFTICYQLKKSRLQLGT